MVPAVQVMYPRLLDHQSLMAAVVALVILQQEGYLVSRVARVAEELVVVCISFQLPEPMALVVAAEELEPVVQGLVGVLE
jgi:hypothetical protein